MVKFEMLNLHLGKAMASIRQAYADISKKIGKRVVLDYGNIKDEGIDKKGKLRKMILLIQTQILKIRKNLLKKKLKFLPHL